jgi:hypothetical protein
MYLLDQPWLETISQPSPKLFARSQWTSIVGQWRQGSTRFEWRHFFYRSHAFRIVIYHHAVQMFNRRPATVSHWRKIAAIIILNRKNPQPVIVFGLNDFVDAVLVVGHGAEMRASAREDLGTDVAAAGHVPKKYAAVQKI